MKIAHHCVSCQSTQIKTRIGQFAPFVAHRVCEYPICYITINEGKIFPTLYTNSVTCEICSFTFSQIRFDSDEMARLYGDYRTNEYAALRTVFEPGYAALHPLVIDGELEKRNRQRVVTNFLKESIEPHSIKSLLDYGGDRGQHIPQIFSNSEKYVYDVSTPQPIDGVKMVYDVNEIGEMDFVMSCNVLEHLPYPGDALDEIKKFCKPTTRVFIDVPCEVLEPSELANSDRTAYFHEHINFFNPSSLKALVETHGFHTVKCDLVDIDYGWEKVQSVYLLAAPNWRFD